MNKKETVNRKELISRISAIMREQGLRKHVPIPKHEFYLSDNEGITKTITIKEQKRDVLYTAEDVEAVIDTALKVVESILKNGEELSIAGYGVLGLKYRKARSTKNVENGEPIDIRAQYVPSFKFGARLKKCANIYLSMLEEKNMNVPLPTFKGGE